MHSVLCLLLLLAVLSFQCAASQQCDVVVTSQASLRKEIKAMLDNVEIHVDGNTSCSSTCSAVFQKLEGELDKKLNTLLDRKLSKVLETVQQTIIEQANATRRQLLQLNSPGGHPAVSCADILHRMPDSPSGYYWVQNRAGQGQPNTQYCDMTRSCGGVTGGWMRVAYLDTTNSSHQCPSGLRQRTDGNKRTCGINSNSAGCSSVTI